MASTENEIVSHDGASDRSLAVSMQEATPAPETPKKTSESFFGDSKLLSTPIKGSPAKPKEPSSAPRIRKKVPWKGKNIMVLLPRDDQRGQPGMPPKPLNQFETQRMFSSWEELGYEIQGFDLVGDGNDLGGYYSQSKDPWPSFDDLDNERRDRKYTVVLPDLNAWKEYQNELMEAKLRALGVTLGDEEPAAPPSVSPATTNPSRQPSAQYPPLPFSPPIPPSSASSNHVGAFPFPAQLNSSAAQSPGITAAASPVSFNGAAAKFNPRASISIPASNSPFQMSQQPSPSGWPGGHRRDSPSLMNLSGIVSPNSPFQVDGVPMSGSPALNLHQRHQSLQYPMLPHQQQLHRSQSWLQEVREVDEETVGKSPSKTPEPPKRNPDALQAEIDDAEYHLEEQMRNQFEHEDYSPHNEAETGEAVPADSQSSVQFSMPEFSAPVSQGPVLHHPRPHSRGHSLSQNFLRDHDGMRDSADESGSNKLGAPRKAVTQNGDESYEIETNPSNLGTPIQNFDFGNMIPAAHQPSFSTASNPWNDSSSAASNAGAPKRPGHASKPSLSKLNVQAPEFKFNPTGSSFNPGGFVFGSTNNGSSFQPPTFQASTSMPAPSMSRGSSHVGSTTSKINASAPAFSPGQSDFSFTASGPKFRPDAPAFTPLQSLSGADSVTSPGSGSDSVGNRPSSIFGNIDLSGADVVKPTKKSKAIPIVRPSSKSSNRDAIHEDFQDGPDGRLAADDSRFKRARGSTAADDAVPLFADVLEERLSPNNALREVKSDQVAQMDNVPSDTKSGDDENAMPADASILSSTGASEPTDAKPTASPSVTSLDQSAMNWTPFEFESKTDMSTFNDARPFGVDSFEKGHKKSLSATAKPFLPASMSFNDSVAESELESAAEPMQSSSPAQPSPAMALGGSRFADSPAPRSASKGLASSRFASPPPKPKGIEASRFASPPTPVSDERQQTPNADDLEESIVESNVETSSPFKDDSERSPTKDELAQVMKHLEDDGSPAETAPKNELTFEEIDARMEHMNKNDPTGGVRKTTDPAFVVQQEPPEWHHPSPKRHISVAAVTNSPFQMAPPQAFTDDLERSPQQYHPLPASVAQPILTTELDDPFVDPPRSIQSLEPSVNRLRTSDSPAPSDWDRAFSEEEQEKLEKRTQFFDGRVNDIVGGLLETRLGPMEKMLLSIQHSLTGSSKRTPSSRRDRRSQSAEIQDSDADDEDEDPVPRRSMSPRRDKRMEHIRAAVAEAFNARERSVPAVVANETTSVTDAAILKALEEMKEQFGASMRLDFRGEDLRNIVEDAVEKRMPATPQPPPADEGLSTKLDEMQAKVMDLEQRLYASQSTLETEVESRRVAQDHAAELERKLQAAESRVEVEIINRSVFDQRVADLEDQLKHQEERTESELTSRRLAEDRLSEVQRLLRIASEEETRLREVVDEKDKGMKAIEQASGKMKMKLALLDANQDRATHSQTELANKMNALEVEAKDSRNEANRWRSEAERGFETVRRHAEELGRVTNENKHLQKVLDTLGVQLQETERIRETWRHKYGTLQDELVRARRDVAEQEARRTKREEATRLRQDALDARIQAESKTRERLETEIERLEMGERQSMRAVGESKRLEALLGDLRTENHHLQQKALKFQRDFEDARESGAREIQRTRVSMQDAIDRANEQVNIVREELEMQNSRLRGEIDNIKLGADTAKAQFEMLIEEAQTSKVSEMEELRRKSMNDTEDMQTRYERQISTAIDEAQKNEQHLLERLSLSTSKSEHLQDKVHHLEEKLEIAKEAAQAAVQRAKSMSVGPSSPKAKAVSQAMQLPEKISPQALRESIMVLQEQLQQREHRIEELEGEMGKVDPEAEVKISKRDDEIMWLRELLAVRHSDLQDIIAALSAENYNPAVVKEATIRLKANLQMEEQERERAMNGGSAINLPSLANSIREAATPRAQELGTRVAAAWGNWRKNGQTSFGSLTGALASPSVVAGAKATPARSSPASSQNLLGGLLTPPASGLRQTPPSDLSRSQPTAFANTGRRYTSQQMAGRSRESSMTDKQAGKMPMQSTPPRRQERGQPPVTPPMMQPSSYDSDAHPGDFDDKDFLDDE